jgi:hypothetical protein
MTSVDEIEIVGSNSPSLLAETIMNGPVAVKVDGNSNIFRNYKGGVITS